MQTADPAAVGEDARCGSHPERSAEATCARCGSFVCAACRAPELPGHCLECASRLGRARFVQHVPALAITMMVHGVLTAGIGLYLLVFGAFFVHSLGEGAPAPEPSPDDGLFSGIMLGAFAAEGVLHLVPGALQLWAGIRVRTFRSRALAFAALGTGLLTIFGCYCAPTSIGLLIWGVIVLVNEDVAMRFSAAGQSGRS